MMKKILGKIYRVRYSNDEERRKDLIWRVLCQDFLQRFIDEKDTVLDIGAGHCEFINNIACGKKYALDIDKRIKKFASPDVEVLITDAQNIPKELKGKINTVFMGCFLEHLPSKETIIKVLMEIKEVLKKDGRLLILNPNIRFSTNNYWDYFDHLTPVSDRSIVEVLQALGFKIELCLPKFVPNTIKDKLPKSPTLVKIYLHLPILFTVFGEQMFIVAKKT